MLNVVGLFLTEIVPLCCSTMFLQLTKPNPIPCCFVVNNGSKIFGKILSGIPGPESTMSFSEYEVKRHREKEKNRSVLTNVSHKLTISEKSETKVGEGEYIVKHKERDCKISDIKDGSQKMFHVGGRHILVIRLGDTVKAFEGICPHAMVQFTDRDLIKNNNDLHIVCDEHWALFDTKTGQPKNQDDFTNRYNCKIEGLDELSCTIDENGTISVTC